LDDWKRPGEAFRCSIYYDATRLYLTCASHAAISTDFFLSPNAFPRHSTAVVRLVFPILTEKFGPSGFFYTGAAMNLVGARRWFLAKPGLERVLTGG